MGQSESERWKRAGQHRRNRRQRVFVVLTVDESMISDSRQTAIDREMSFDDACVHTRLNASRD